MNKERLLKTLQILVEIDKLITQLGMMDPYGDIVENFAEVPDKRPTVTKRLIRMVKKDLLKHEKRC